MDNNFRMNVAETITTEMRPSFFEELSIVELKCDAFKILMWINTPKQMQHNSQKFSKTERPTATEEMFPLVVDTLGCYMC